MLSSHPPAVCSRPRRQAINSTSGIALFAALLLLVALVSVGPAGAVELNQVGFWSGANCQDVAVYLNKAYVAADTLGLLIIDVNNPGNPFLLGSYDTPGTAFGVAFKDWYAYVADGAAGLRVIDVSDSTNPTEVGFLDTPGEAVQVFVSGNYAYVADGPGGLRVIDISAPGDPAEVGSSEIDYAHDVFVLGDRAYVAADNVLGTLGSGDGLRIYDISNPSSPTAVNFVSTPGNAYGVYVTERHAYVADDTQGLRIIAGIDSIGQMEYGSLVTQGYANKVSVYGDYAYMTASTYGLYVIDVSNAHHPFQAAFFPITGHVRGVFAAGDYVYLCNNDPDYGGLYILQLVSEPTPPPPPPTGGLVGYWPFNMGNGTVAHDSTANEHHGSIEGATWYIPGVRDACLSFENGYVRIGDEGDDGVLSYTADQNFTWALWIKPGDVDYPRKVIMSRRMIESNTDSVSMNISYMSHSILVRMGAYPTSGSELYSGPVLVESRWYHLAVVRDTQAGLYRLYVDGTLVSTSEDHGADLSAPASCWIGQDPVSPEASEQYHGLIDEVMVFDCALPLSEIEALASWLSPEEQDSVTVVSPNGGEVWQAGSSHDITWSSAGSITDVRIEYSIDGGSNWATVSDSTENDGIHPWTAPYDSSGHCLVRISECGGQASDTSDYPFTITMELSVFSIVDIADIPNDQGKQARVRWTRHVCDSADTPASALIIGYSVWRMVDSARESTLTRPADTPDGLWEQVGLTPAVQDEIYSLVVPTIADSTIVSGMYYSIFFVRAHTAYPAVHYETAPDSGWSVDNLVPAAPVATGRRLATGVNRIEWSESVDEDFNYFRIFRSDLSGFQIAADSPLAATTDNWYEDAPPDADKFYYYRIAAVDFSGNMGPCSEEIAVSLTGIDGAAAALPDKFDLAQNFPNPFNPETTIRFATPEDSFVGLCVYNIFGQLVRTLKNERLPAGYHQVRWDGLDNYGRPAGSGVYFYSIRAGDYIRTRRMVLLK